MPSKVYNLAGLYQTFWESQYKGTVLLLLIQFTKQVMGCWQGGTGIPVCKMVSSELCGN